MDNRIDRGDFITLQKVLNLPYSTVVTRFKRNKEQEVLLMKEIVKAREKTIKTLKDRLKK